MSGPDTLRTARLTLRPVQPLDAAPLAELADDFDVVRMTTRMPFPYTLTDGRTFTERAAQADPAREATWVVTDEAGPQGVLGFFSDGAYAPELGYWFGRRTWGRGYATEAVGAAVAWADGVWRKPCLLARCFTDNPASGRVLEKTGFLTTGIPGRRYSVARRDTYPCREYLRIA
jgi:RimJ/RimL family protein N-acetyltransferase